MSAPVDPFVVSFPGAPIATIVPSADIQIEYPDWSPDASPSMSSPIRVQPIGPNDASDCDVTATVLFGVY